MALETRSARSGSSATGDPVPSIRAAQQGVFRKEGEYWTVGHGGKAFRLKDTKGLGYIAYLLRHPAAEFHVLDLFGGMAGRREEHESSQSVHGLPRAEEDLEKAGIHITNLGDAGEMLDEQAKVAYKRRLSELREELEEAKEFGKVERAEHAEEEIAALTREISRAVGLGGRDRRAASASERARQTVTKSIKSVLERIAQSDATFADLLSRCIKTGTFCSYQPDVDFPLTWELEGTIAEPAEEPVSIDDPVPAHADQRQAVPAPLFVSQFPLAKRTAMVGRETERRAIRATIDRALSGHGSVVMLSGGPGMGKTRLAMEMAEYAARLGFHTFVGHSYEGDEPVPYLPFVEMIERGLTQAASLEDFRRRMGDSAAALAEVAPTLRRVFPDIPQLPELPPAQKRRYLFQSVSEAVVRAARTRSYLYIFEDLHWTDDSTLGLLIHLANRITELPVVIIGTYRDEYSAGNPTLVRTLEELIRLGIRPLKLSGLSKEAVAQMLNGLSQRQAPENLVSAIFDGSQGNPLFVEGLHRHLIERERVFDAAGQFRTDITIEELDVPENVRVIVSRLFERLDATEKQVSATPAHAAGEPRGESAPSRPSLAVLPFANMSDDPEQAYLSDGITEDITVDLSQVSALFVVARNKAFTFKGKAVEITQVARQLNVRYLLDGSVRRGGNQVRVTAQLIDGTTGGHLWAERYDREFGDVFALQDDITKNVVAALKVRLLPAELKSIEGRSTSNSLAYEYYLRGRSKFFESWGSTSTMKAARELFAKAVEVDSTYARAYTGIADCDAFLWINGDLEIAYEDLLNLSSRALELAPEMAEAHASRGIALWVAGRAEEAAAAFERAIELDSFLSEAHFFYALNCRDRSDFDRAAALFERAAELRSDDFASLTLLANVYELKGRVGLARETARRSLIRIESTLNQRPDAAEVLGVGAATLVYLGENARAEEWARRAVWLEPGNFTVRYNAACTYAVIGEADAALEQLEYIRSQVARARPWLLKMIKNDPQFDSLRERVDFQIFMQLLAANAGAKS